MNHWILLCMLFALGYALLLSAYHRGWRALPMFKLPGHFSPQKSITVLLPARNEARQIETCLQAVLSGSYPSALLEVIVMDDFSEDETAHIVQSFSARVGHTHRVALLQLADHLPLAARFTANKKKAIALGVARARGEIIVTTDADTLAPNQWLLHIAAVFENAQIQAVCAPVVFHREKNLLQRFQSLDFLGLMGISGAGAHLGWHYMANGANLAYRKQAFEAVDGFSGNAHLASGDDMFLVQKIAARWPDGLRFLKSLNATVQTEAVADLRSFWHQRLRWGTKNAAMANWPLRLSLLGVFLFCCSIWVNLALSISSVEASVGQQVFFEIFLFQLLFKALADYFLLSELSAFFNRRDLLRWFIPSFLMHTAYLPLLGLASLFLKRYAWKGRRSQ